MTFTKAEREERQRVIDLTGAEWIGKNTFRMHTDPAIAIQILINNGFTSASTIYPLYHPLGFVFEARGKLMDWFFNVAFKDFDIVSLFKFIDTSLYHNGYTGTNEWKHDICRHLKIPMKGKLSYLNPSGKYWFCDELHGGDT